MFFGKNSLLQKMIYEVGNKIMSLGYIHPDVYNGDILIISSKTKGFLTGIEILNCNLIKSEMYSDQQLKKFITNNPSGMIEIVPEYFDIKILNNYEEKIVEIEFVNKVSDLIKTLPDGVIKAKLKRLLKNN